MNDVLKPGAGAKQAAKAKKAADSRDACGAAGQTELHQRCGLTEAT